MAVPIDFHSFRNHIIQPAMKFNSKNAFFTNTSQIGGHNILTSDLILRTIALVLGIISFALSISSTTYSGTKSSSANFAIFASVFSIIYGSIFGISIYMFKRIKPILVLITDVWNLIFTFAAGVALGHKSQQCSKKHNHCSAGKAGATFLFFLFFLYIGSLLISIVRAFNNYKNSKEESNFDNESLGKSHSQQASGTYPDTNEIYSNPFLTPLEK